MPRLPAVLEPAYPLVKRAHRFATRVTGSATRARAHHTAGPRSVPRIGTTTSLQTVQQSTAEVTLHTGGPSVSVSRTMPVGTPADHWYFRDLLETTFMPRYTLEIRGGVVVGDYCAHVTPDGVLDYQTSPYFGIEGWHEHPIYLRPRLPPPADVPGTVLSLATRGTSVNYYHVLLDLLERYAVFCDSMPDTRADVLLVNRNTSFARQYLDLLGLGDCRAIEPTKHLAVRAERLLVPSLPNTDNLAPPWTTQWLRERLRPTSTAGLPRRIYVTRGQRRNTRRVTNEAELLDVLRPLGFTVFDPGEHSVQHQINQFAAAEVVVGPHGAGLANLVFAPEGVRILELFAPRYLNPGYWTIACNLKDARYRYLVAHPGDTRPSGARMVNVYDDLVVDVAAFRAALDELLGP